MALLQNNHAPAVLCQLGDGALTGAGVYPGLYIRAGAVAGSGFNTEGYMDYPSTTPDQITKLIRIGPGTSSGYFNKVNIGANGYVAVINVSSGFPPTPITGSPFTVDTRGGPGSGYYASIYPRWTGETAWDLQTYPATNGFTPQGLATGDIFSYLGSPLSSTCQNAVSFETGILPNDPAIGGDSSFIQDAEFVVEAVTDEVCCWNEGTSIELNVDIWQLDFTATYQAGVLGVFDITVGSTATYHSTLTQTVTVDSSWATAGNRVHTFVIPKVTGYFTFVNDFYVSAITYP